MLFSPACAIPHLHTLSSTPACSLKKKLQGIKEQDTVMNQHACVHTLCPHLCTCSLKKLQDIKEKDTIMNEPTRWLALSSQVGRGVEADEAGVDDVHTFVCTHVSPPRTALVVKCGRPKPEHIPSLAPLLGLDPLVRCGNPKPSKA